MEFVFDPLRFASDVLRDPMARVKGHVWAAGHDMLTRLRAAAANPFVYTDAAAGAPPPVATTFLALLQPQMRPTDSAGLRRIIEPVVAVVALGILGTALAVAATSLVGFVLACLLALAIVSQVFGLSLNFDLPGSSAP
jgi:hypothetical protein